MVGGRGEGGGVWVARVAWAMGWGRGQAQALSYDKQPPFSITVFLLNAVTLRILSLHEQHRSGLVPKVTFAD